MKFFPGTLCIGETGNTYIGIYNFNYVIYVKPPVHQDKIEYLAHVTYSKGGKKGSVDYYKIPLKLNPRELIKLNKEILIQNQEVIIINKEDKSKKIISDFRECDYDYDICEETILTDGIEKRDIFNFSRADIKDFCEGKKAKVHRNLGTIVVDKIIPKTEIKYLNPKRLLWGGKSDFVKECKLEANLDYFKGCFSGFIPEQGAYFDGQFFHNYFSIPFFECGYCYAEFNHKSFPKTVYKIDQQKLKQELLGKAKLTFNSEKEIGRKIKILRLGKRTESWTPFNHEDFLKTLETCVETGTSCIIPTKFMQFNKDIANLLIKTNSVPLFSSNGNDKISELELGPNAHGAIPEWRIEQAFKYKEAGVNSSIYLQIIANQPPTQKELQIIEQTDYGKKLPIQLLPLRMRKNITKALTGETFEHLSEQKNQITAEYGDSNQRGDYIKEGRMLLVKHIHPFWLNLVKQNNERIRLCHHDDESVYCGSCFQGNGFICKNTNHNV